MRATPTSSAKLIDGSVGLRPSAPSLPRHDEAWWDDYRDRLEDASRQAG